MIRLDAATFLLQWATGGLFFLWVTTRRRIVGLGYGWLLRSVYGVMAVGALVLLVPACGTRLPNSAFSQLNGGSSISENRVAAGDNGANSDTGTTVAGSSGGGATQAGGASATTVAGGAQSNGGGGQAAQNTASDVGVTPTSIKIGNITGLGGPLGPDAFGPTLRGLQV